MTTNTTTPRMGRPCQHDYPARAAEIQSWIDQGDSIVTIAGKLNLSYTGARLALQRLGIETIPQKIRRLGLAAVLDQVK